MNTIAGRHEGAGVVQFFWLAVAITLLVVAFFQTVMAFGGIVTSTRSLLFGAVGWLAVWLVMIWRFDRRPNWLILSVTILTTASIAGLCTPLVAPLALGVNAGLAIMSFFFAATKFIDARKL